MHTDQKGLELVNSASKFETLLYQFIKLYDRLTVEHALITERELKIVAKLENLDQTLIELNKKLVKLDQLGPQLTTDTASAINMAVSNNWEGLSKSIATNTERRISTFCIDLNNASSKMRFIVDEYDNMKKSFNLKIWAIMFLLGLLFWAGGGYWYVKKVSKCMIIDLEVYKRMYQNNNITKK